MDPKTVKEWDETPFKGMKIDDTSILDDIEGRSACANCSKSRKYFCYTCYIPVEGLRGRIPNLKLPFEVDIIKHKHEIDGKSTAIHGAILAPEHIKIYTYPDIPDYGEEEKVFLIYPSMKACNVTSLFHDFQNLAIEENPKQNRTLMINCFGDDHKNESKLSDLKELPIKKAVFIDSTWNQSRGIYKDNRIKSLQCLVIQNRASQFWRHQKGSPRWYLSTIEAIHQFLLESHLNMWGVSPYYEGPYCDNFKGLKMDNDNKNVNNEPYCGQYDNLLFFFSHMYLKIHSIYSHDQLLAYKRRLT